MSGIKKEYVLVSSDNRTADSVSTTDFTLRLAVPITKVIKTDLIQLSMDYNIANIKAPHNTFVLGTNTATNTISLEEGLYTVDVLSTWLQTELHTIHPGYSVTNTISKKLVIELTLGEEDAQTITGRNITASATVSYLLGITSTLKSSGTLKPTLVAADGPFGTIRWTFPFSAKLTGISPYLFIQSRALGTDIKVANGATGFWRMLLNDQENNSLSMMNNRVDTYTSEPRTLQDIDVTLVYPDGSNVNNNGGRFTLLLEIVRLV